MLVFYLVLCVFLIVLFTAKIKVHPFIVLLLVALLYGFLSGMPVENILSSVNEGFGNTLGGIGLLIILGVIIGAFMENTGAAFVIAEKILNIVGRKRVPTAMGFMGYIVSIPVFADSGFLLLSSLNKSLCKKAGITLAGSTIALSIGLTASHTMVPPTPGPIAAAGILNADLGLVLMVGIPVSLIALSISLIFAYKYVSRTYIDPGVSEEPEVISHAPGVTLSILPVLVPILLIVGRSLVRALEIEDGLFIQTVDFLGTPFVALLVGVGLAFLLPKKWEEEMFNSSGWIAKAISTAASVILITGAGGIFGKMLQNSGIADSLSAFVSQWPIGIWLPFLLAAAIKTAQGSSTVALITTASIVAPLMESLGFHTGLDKALVVIAIGAGSACVSHANDSFFWVVTQMSNMDLRTGYRTHTLGTAVLGVSAATTVFLIHLVV